MQAIRLVLYVAGDTQRSRQAEDNVRALCRDHLAGVDLLVVDVVREPDEAERERVLTTPMIVRTHPAPPRRATGDLGDAGRVLAALDLQATPPPSEQP